MVPNNKGSLPNASTHIHNGGIYGSTYIDGAPPPQPPPHVSAKVLEKAARDDGLQQAISSDNKGFRMLQKMGYKAGDGLGKQRQGIAEPVCLDVNRVEDHKKAGLGREIKQDDGTHKRKTRKKNRTEGRKLKEAKHKKRQALKRSMGREKEIDEFKGRFRDRIKKNKQNIQVHNQDDQRGQGKHEDCPQSLLNKNIQMPARTNWTVNAGNENGSMQNNYPQNNYEMQKNQMKRNFITNEWNVQYEKVNVNARNAFVSVSDRSSSRYQQVHHPLMDASSNQFPVQARNQYCYRGEGKQEDWPQSLLNMNIQMPTGANWNLDSGNENELLQNNFIKNDLRNMNDQYSKDAIVHPVNQRNALSDSNGFQCQQALPLMEMSLEQSAGCIKNVFYESLPDTFQQSLFEVPSFQGSSSMNMQQPMQQNNQRIPKHNMGGLPQQNMQQSQQQRMQQPMQQNNERIPKHNMQGLPQQNMQGSSQQSMQQSMQQNNQRIPKHDTEGLPLQNMQGSPQQSMQGLSQQNMQRPLQRNMQGPLSTFIKVPPATYTQGVPQNNIPWPSQHNMQRPPSAYANGPQSMYAQGSSQQNMLPQHNKQGPMSTYAQGPQQYMQGPLSVYEKGPPVSATEGSSNANFPTMMDGKQSHGMASSFTNISPQPSQYNYRPQQQSHDGYYGQPASLQQHDWSVHSQLSTPQPSAEYSLHQQQNPNSCSLPLYQQGNPYYDQAPPPPPPPQHQQGTLHAIAPLTQNTAFYSGQVYQHQVS